MDRVTVGQAAHILGIKEESVRKRVSRGTLRSEKDEDGRLLVYVDGAKTLRDGYADGSATSEPGGADGLVSELRDRVRYLERQVEEEREARRRADMLLARLVERVPELEPPQDASESPSRPGPSDTPTEAGEGPQEAAEHQRGWFRRFFGL